MGNNESYQKSHNFFGPPLGSSLCRHWCNPHLATTAHTGADTAFDRREVYGCHLLHRVGANRFTAAHAWETTWAALHTERRPLLKKENPQLCWGAEKLKAMDKKELLGKVK